MIDKPDNPHCGLCDQDVDSVEILPVRFEDVEVEIALCPDCEPIAGLE